AQGPVTLIGSPARLPSPGPPLTSGGVVRNPHRRGSWAARNPISQPETWPHPHRRDTGIAYRLHLLLQSLLAQFWHGAGRPVAPCPGRHLTPLRSHARIGPGHEVARSEPHQQILVVCQLTPRNASVLDLY